MLLIKQIIKFFSLTLLSGALVFSKAFAGLIPADLDISINTLFDNSYSYGPVAGTYGHISGGVQSNATFNGGTTTVNPMLHQLTQDGDGIYFLGGTNNTVFNQEYAIGIDSFMTLENNSATDTIEIVLELVFSNDVTADGADAFADSESRLLEDGNEIYFSDLISDTLNGNFHNGIATGASGGSISDAGTHLFSFTLNPMATISLELDWTAWGGDFGSDGSALQLDKSLKIKSTNVASNPSTPIPEPDALVLLVIGLLIFQLRLKQKRC